MRIAITDNFRPKPVFDNYGKWIRRVNPDVEMVKLSSLLKNASSVQEADGLILTGGGDVHPGLYGRDDAIGLVEEVNEQRDAFEFEVIERALDVELPILGICRGMQVMNVYLGGTLIIDLPTEGYRSHVERDGVDHRHPLVTVPNTLLEVMTGPGPLRVNSIHHQAVEKTGKGLMVSAKSDDGVIEALEWVLKDRMPFLLLVQWHPERMHDYDNPCSCRIAEYFLREAERFMNAKREQLSEKETE